MRRVREVARGVGAVEMESWEHVDVVVVVAVLLLYSKCNLFYCQPSGD